jgi:hypothetical protein
MPSDLERNAAERADPPRPPTAVSRSMPVGTEIGASASSPHLDPIGRASTPLTLFQEQPPPPQSVLHPGVLKAGGLGGFSAGAAVPRATQHLVAGPFFERPRSAVDNVYFLAQVVSLEQTACKALEEVEAQRQNDTALRDLLVELIHGLHQLVLVLQEAVAANPDQPIFQGKAAVIVNDLRDRWFRFKEKNGDEVFEYWVMRLPALAAFTALLHSAGADMTFATPAVTAALLGGPEAINKVVQAGVQRLKK